jgi:hypothetical protein
MPFRRRRKKPASERRRAALPAPREDDASIEDPLGDWPEES